MEFSERDSMESVVITRIAVAFERIASALERKAVDSELPKIKPDHRDVLRELLKHCESQSNASKLRSSKLEGGFYTPSKNVVDGNKRASEKWTRFAGALREILEDS